MNERAGLKETKPPALKRCVFRPKHGIISVSVYGLPAKFWACRAMSNRHLRPV